MLVEKCGIISCQPTDVENNKYTMKRCFFDESIMTSVLPWMFPRLKSARDVGFGNISKDKARKWQDGLVVESHSNVKHMYILYFQMTIAAVHMMFHWSNDVLFSSIGQGSININQKTYGRRIITGYQDHSTWWIRKKCHNLHDRCHACLKDCLIVFLDCHVFQPNILLTSFD